MSQEIRSSGIASVFRTHDGRVAHIWFGDPARANTIDDEIVGSVIRVLDSVVDDVRAVVLGSNGRTFCGGGNFDHLLELSQGPADQIGDRISGRFQALIKRIIKAPVPIVARVQGPAVGAGADIMLACDTVIASRKAWIRESWLRLGLIPALGGVPSLRTALGRGKAFDALITGRDIGAEECHAAGLFHRLVEHEDLDNEVDDFLDEILQRGSHSVEMLKSLMRGDEAGYLEAHFARTVAAQQDLFKRPHFQTAIAAEAARIRERAGRRANLPG